MSRRQTTGQIIKERLSVLTVIISCLILVVVVQEVRQFFDAQSQRPTATPVVTGSTATPFQDEPQTVQVTAQPTTAAVSSPSSSPALSPSKPTNLSGKWTGLFSETIDGNTYQYRYILELSQQGNFIAGKSTIEKEGAPDTFAQFVIRGQIVQNTTGHAIKITEDLVGAKNLRTGSAAAPRNTQLSYFSSEDQEYLEGEWVDRRYSAQDIAGTVTLTKQP